MRWLSLPLALLALLVVARPASACTCSRFVKFDEVTQKAPVVVVGRVVAVGTLAPAQPERNDPGSIDLDVLWTAKGISSSQVRAWNQFAGSTCGGAFQSTSVGMRLVIALRRIGDVTPRPQEFWDLIKFRAPDSDYIITTTSVCGEVLTILKTDKDVADWMGKTIK